MDVTSMSPGETKSDCASAKTAQDATFPICSPTGPCYADVTLAQAPSLDCVSKTFDKTTISTSDATISVTGSIRNNGTVDLTDMVVTDQMGTKMTYAGGSTIGAPVETPVGSGIWKFPARSLGIGQTLIYAFNVSVTGVNVNETICDQITASSAQYSLSDDGPECRACVTRREQNKVPAMNTVGLVALFALVAAGGVLLLRRRQRA